MINCTVCNKGCSKTKDSEVSFCKSCKHFLFTPKDETDRTLNHPKISESLEKIRVTQAKKISLLIKEYLDNEIRLIEIGAGKGYLISEFKKIFPNSTALDVDDTFKEELLKKKIKFINGDVENIKNFNNYDLILGSHVIEHLKEPKKLIKIANESQVKYLVFLLPINEGMIFKTASLFLKLNIPVFWNRLFQKMSNSPHFQYFSNNSITKLFELNNYRVVKTIKINMADFTPNFKRVSSTENKMISLLAGFLLPLLEIINLITGKNDGAVYFCEIVD